MDAHPPVLHLMGSAGEGGAESYFVRLAAALQAAGVPTSAAIRDHAGRRTALAAAGVEHRLFGFGTPIDLVTRRGVAAMARERQARVLVAWLGRAGRHTPKGPWARVARVGGYNDLKAFQGFDVLAAETEDLRAWAIGQGWEADRVACIPPFAEAGSAPAQSRTTLDTPKDAPLLLAVGRLHPSKCHADAVRALVEVPEAWLWIAGSGALEGALRALALDLGVQDRVRWLGWRGDMSALYRAADICVLPARGDPSGRVVIEAWAHGVPVVAGRSKGAEGLIRDGVDGLLTPLDDPSVLAANLRGLIAEPELRARLAAAGRARAEAEHSREAVLTRWIALFDRLGGEG